MSQINLIKNFTKKYSEFITGSFLYWEQDHDENKINFNNINSKDKKLLQDISYLMTDVFMENEIERSLEYTILPPYIFKGNYCVCPYTKNDKLELSIVIFSLYWKR